MSLIREPRAAPPSLDLDFRQKIKRLLFCRLLLAVFFLLLTLLVQSRRQGDLLSAHLQPLYFFACILFLFTVVAGLSLKYARNLRRFTYIQLFFDVEAVTVLIYLSGGIESLFSFLYMPVIIGAALLLFRRGSLLVASMCSLSYGLLLDLQYFHWVAPLQVVAERTHFSDSGTYFHTILMNVTGFYLVAFLSGYLAEELQKSSEQVQRQESDLHQLELLHRNIVQSMHSGLLTINPPGYILSCNHAAIEILAVPADQVLGQRFEKIIPSLDPSSWPRLPNGSSPIPPNHQRREVFYRRPSGEEACLGYTVAVLQKEGGETSGWIFIFQDLTRLKAMEEHVQRMERLAFAGRIAAEIAHEIKNPLAAMSGAVQMLNAQIGRDSVQNRLVRIVHREIDRINELVTDFLWLAKGSKKPEKTEEIAVHSVIQEVLSLLRAREKLTPGHRVQTRFESSSTIVMDPHHFRQILWNLLLNALEAMPEGGSVVIGVSEAGVKASEAREIRIDVRDMGCGIEEEFRPRVFEPFFTSKPNGTGLGLSIVYQLVENAGGRIEVSHHENAGTTFSLFLPCQPSFSLAN